MIKYGKHGIVYRITVGERTPHWTWCTWKGVQLVLSYCVGKTIEFAEQADQLSTQLDACKIDTLHLQTSFYQSFCSYNWTFWDVTIIISNARLYIFSWFTSFHFWLSKSFCILLSPRSLVHIGDEQDLDNIYLTKSYTRKNGFYLFSLKIIIVIKKHPFHFQWMTIDWMQNYIINLFTFLFSVCQYIQLLYWNTLIDSYSQFGGTGFRKMPLLHNILPICSICTKKTHQRRLNRIVPYWIYEQ